MSEETKEKVTSRKFLVWVTWLVISIIILVVCAAGVFITRELSESFTALIEKIITSFFYISMMDLGVNVVQKGAFAISDVLSGKKEEEE